jgi:hypothetical protein
MKYHTFVNFPGGVQMDFGQRERFRHETEIQQGGKTYLVDRVRLNTERREQTVTLRRA